MDDFYRIELGYIVHATAHLITTKRKLEAVLNEKRYGSIDGDFEQKIKTLITENAEEIADTISMATHDLRPLLTSMGEVDITQKYRLDGKANVEDSGGWETLDILDEYLTLQDILWITDVEVKEN